MLAMTGWNSQIAVELRKIAHEKPTDFRNMRSDPEPGPDDHGWRYLFCGGVLIGKPANEQTDAEIADSITVNFAEIAMACDEIINRDVSARICIVGSESGISGSYDPIYGGSKAAIHHYVETKKLKHPGQQLVAVAPTIIENAGMTERRTDVAALAKRAAEHPKKRFLQALEVAQVIKFLLYECPNYLTGTVIRIHGGKAHQ